MAANEEYAPPKSSSMLWFARRRNCKADRVPKVGVLRDGRGLGVEEVVHRGIHRDGGVRPAPPRPSYDGTASEHARRIIEVVIADNPVGRRAA